MDLSSPDTNVGAWILLQMFTTDEWIHRRVHTIRFVGEARAQRQVSVDLDVNAPGGLFEDVCPGQVLVPLALIEKRVLHGFDLRDEADASVPVCTASQNQWVAWSALCAAAEINLNADLTEDERLALWKVASAEIETKASAKDCLLTHARLENLLREEQSRSFDRVLEEFASNFLLLAVVHPEPRRRVLKYRHDQFVNRWGKWSSRLGWAPWVLRVKTGRLEGRSNHLEVRAPDGVQFARAPLFDVEEDAQLSARSKQTADVSHLHFSRKPDLSSKTLTRRTPSPFVYSGDVYFSLIANVRGLARGSLLVSWVVAFLVFCGAAWPDIVASLQGPSGDADAATALLLAVLGALTLFVVRQREHAIVSEILLGLRIVVLIVGAFMPFLAALTVVVDDVFHGAILNFAWISAAVVSISGAISLTVSYRQANRYSKIHARTRRS